MVKNAFGGSKSKSIARKHETSTSQFIRMIQDPSEKFAIVKKIFGGSICQVFCDDLLTRQAIIRGKFRGKGKRHNIISSGTLVLVGLRDFSHSLICDIIEVYSPTEFYSISQKPSFPSFILHNNIQQHHDDDFLFDNSTSHNELSNSHIDISPSIDPDSHITHTDSFDFNDI
jgi:initiation factor 1A